MRYVSYNREKAVNYAMKWALSRNPQYYNFDGLGGDCTNFASQCLYAGCGVMNYEKDVGWYYNSINDRSAAWSSAEYLHKFLLNNKSTGPFAAQVSVWHLEIGDYIQLNNDFEYYHTLIITGFDRGVPLVCAHTDDSYMRRLDTYYYNSASGLHILGAGAY
ncbi:MAG: amidase domain-containing protein [Eubacterium sp.]